MPIQVKNASRAFKVHVRVLQFTDNDLVLAKIASTRSQSSKIKRNKNKNMTYSSSLAVGRRQFTPRNQNSTSYKNTRSKLGPISNTIILVVLMCVLGLLYLTQVTKANTYGYRINFYENSRLNQLKSMINSKQPQQDCRLQTESRTVLLLQVQYLQLLQQLSRTSL